MSGREERQVASVSVSQRQKLTVEKTTLRKKSPPLALKHVLAGEATKRLTDARKLQSFKIENFGKVLKRGSSERSVIEPRMRVRKPSDSEKGGRK